MTWQVVGQIGGPTQAVAVQGDYAYVGVGLRLVVLDVSNPITLTEVGSTTPFPYFVEDIVVSGTLAYVAAGGAGLRAVDVSDPANPAELGAWDSPGYAEGVAVAGNTVYLADGPYGLRVVDVSDPAHPVPVGAAYDMNYAFEVAVSGHHAYIAAAGAGLLVVDVSDPAHPVEVGALDTPGYAYGITVSGTLAYVADAWEGLRVVNLTDPAHPTLLGVYDTPGWALNVAVAGTTAYVADGAFGLHIVDVSDPAHPAEIGALGGMGLARRVAVAGDVAYMADLREGLRLIDVTAPARPVQIGLYSLLAEARRVAVAGHYAYVAAGFSGLRIVDIADPSHPREVGAFDLGDDGYGGQSYASSVVVSGTYVYLASHLHGPLNFHVFDVSDPAFPNRISAINCCGANREIALQDEIVYVADEGGLSLVSVADPANAIQIGFIRLNQNHQDTVGVAISGTLAYVADAGSGVKIVDVSNPVSLTVVGAWDPPGLFEFVEGVTVVGYTAYVAEATDGLRIVDVSDPAGPVEIGFFDTPGTPAAVAVSGTLAYVSDGGGVQVVDVSVPSSPTLRAALGLPGFAWHTAVAGDYLYVADGRAGLLILERTSAGGGLDAPLAPEGSLAIPGDLSSTLPGVTGQIESTCVVTSTANSGPGTLRQCLTSVSSGDTITFDPAIFSPTSPATITLTAPLPSLTQGQVTIDASDAGVILDGSATPAGTTGLVITSDGNAVRGLQILYFPGNGMSVGGQYNRIGGDRSQGSGPLGEGNLFSGNGGDGLQLSGTDNTVVGNFIGTDVSGGHILANEDGVRIGGGASHNVVGGQTPGERNVISGNHNNQVELSGAGTEYNVVQGNLIGTDAGGTRALRDLAPTGGSGVSLHSGARRNVIGPGNVIAGVAFGVAIGLEGTNDNTITGNWIGTDVSGTGVIGVYYCGVSVSGGTQRNRVGPANRIAHSGNLGVQVQGATTLSNTITANAIYNNGKGIGNQDGGNASLPPPVIATATITTVTGTALPGARLEVFSDREDEGQVYEGWITVTASGVFTFTKPAGLTGPHVTATATDAAGNTSEFSAPVLAVMHTGTLTVTSPLDSGPGTLRQAILDAWPGNTITFDPVVFPPAHPVTISLTNPLPPLSQGHITIDASNAGVILDGGNLAGDANGLVLASDHNAVRGLQILHFGGIGLYVNDGRDNVIGGDRFQGTGPTGQGNLASANAFGMAIKGENAVGNVVIGNLIGTDSTGTSALGNYLVGLQLQDGASYNRIGGTSPAERNVVSGNPERGIQIIGEGVTGNAVIGNYIGTDITGMKPLGNGRGGVVIESGADNNVVGGTSPGERNVISGNGCGALMSDPDTTGNVVIGNYIGTNATGTAALGNGYGVGIWMSGFNRVGGTTSLERNVISGNGAGVAIGGKEMSDNLVLGNYIGTDPTGTWAIPNGSGVSINEGTRHNFVGGMTPAEVNVVSGNGIGVRIGNDGIMYNWVAGNAIGVSADGLSGLGNTWVGVLLEEYSSNNFVQGNAIAYNTEAGVYVTDSFYNVIRRNSIHSNGARGIFLTNGGNQMLPAPLILTVTETSVSGTACPGCTVEVYSDDDDEGRVYEGTTIADAAGHFSFDKGGPLTGPYLTATATDGQGNTSEFSAPVARPVKVYLPIVLKGQ